MKLVGMMFFFFSKLEVANPLLEYDFWDLLMCATVRLPENGSLSMQSLKSTKYFIASSFL